MRGSCIKCWPERSIRRTELTHEVLADGVLPVPGRDARDGGKVGGAHRSERRADGFELLKPMHAVAGHFFGLERQTEFLRDLQRPLAVLLPSCLLYTSDAADE